MKRFALLAALAAMLTAGGAQGAAFALIEQNASGLGNAYAGLAAVAEDASTIFFNPAGLTHVEGRQAVLAGHLIAPSAKLSAASGSTAAGLGNGGDAGDPIFLPNAYFAMDAAPGIKFGVGLNAPFGLATEYDFPWAGQTQALKSDLETVNVNPSLAWRVNDRLSLGLGIDWQYIDAELTQSTGFPGVLATMRGNDSSWGWNLGALWDVDGFTRFGLAYRSGISHRLAGTLNTVPGRVYADVSLPDTVSLSLFHRLGPYWDFLADLTWTGWGSFDQLEVVGSPAPAIQENWENTRRYSVGLTYHRDRAWSWRMGLAYDETPVPDAAHRTPRIPDADRTWVAMGGQYRFSPAAAVDFGYAHLFVRDAAIDHVESGVRLSGTYLSHIDIVGVQYTRIF